MKNNVLIFRMLCLVLLGLTHVVELVAQDTIRLKNPSFEGIPSSASVPKSWKNIGLESESPPDIQPGSFQVSMAPHHGKTYLGMVVRDNETWEGVGQQLESSLLKDSVYTFSIWLARSKTFISSSKLTNQVANYTSPTILRIWGVNTKTKEEELLAETTAISHSLWMQYTFELAPTLADFDEINLMAFYAKGFEYKNGNILLDHCSDIVK